MPNYIWVCHSCASTNPADFENCNACGCPAVASLAEIEEAKTGVKQPPLGRIRRLMKQAFLNILLSPVKTTIAVFICVSAIVFWLSATYYKNSDFYPGILVEAHGMLLDMVVVGIFLLLIENFRNTKNEIARNKELIEDLKYWKSDEASYRIRGAILRLNRLGITEMDLEGCHLKNIDLQSISLRRSKLFSADLGGADIRKVDLSECNLKGAYFGDSDCRGTSFRNSSLHRTRCRRSNMIAACFAEAQLEKTEFFDTNLQNADFRGAKLEGCKFKGANLRQANFKGATIIGVQQFLDSVAPHLAIFDHDVMAQLESECGIVFNPQCKQLTRG